MSRSRWIALIVGEVLALCCCAGLFGFIAVGNSTPKILTPTLIAKATGTQRPTGTLQPTSTAERTNTLVIQPRTTATTPPPTARGTRSATLAITPQPISYDLVVPTPTAPSLAYPITFNETFAVVTYTVTGKTVDELDKSLQASALSDPHEPTRRFYARTNWSLSQSIFQKETSLGCEVDSGQVNIAITVTLPALAITAGVPPDVQNRWNTFIQHTQEHESGHVTLVQQGSRDHQRDIGNFPPAPNCDVMKVRLRDLLDKNFSTIDNANVYYDAKTQHGFTQHAVFP